MMSRSILVGQVHSKSAIGLTFREWQDADAVPGYGGNAPGLRLDRVLLKAYGRTSVLWCPERGSHLDYAERHTGQSAGVEQPDYSVVLLASEFIVGLQLVWCYGERRRPRGVG